MVRITVSNGDEAMTQIGLPRLARKNGLIQRRLVKGEREIIQTAHGPQEAVAGEDYVAIQADGVEYPYKAALFEINMEESPSQPGYFRKKTLSRLIEIPANTVVDCVTIDGGEQKPLQIEAPDFLCVGAANEVYPLSRSTFDRDFSWAEEELPKGGIF